MMKNGLLVFGLVVGLFSFETAAIEPQAVPPVIVSAIENRIDIRPVVHIGPSYPTLALEQNIEGYCKVSFDIKLNEFSTPTNIEILKCSPLNIFENSCVSAVSKWAFLAKNTTESGKGLITTCKFELD